MVGEGVLASGFAAVGRLLTLLEVLALGPGGTVADVVLVLDSVGTLHALRDTVAGGVGIGTRDTVRGRCGRGFDVVRHGTLTVLDAFLFFGDADAVQAEGRPDGTTFLVDTVRAPDFTGLLVDLGSVLRAALESVDVSSDEEVSLAALIVEVVGTALFRLVLHGTALARDVGVITTLLFVAQRQGLPVAGVATELGVEPDGTAVVTVGIGVVQRQHVAGTALLLLQTVLTALRVVLSSVISAQADLLVVGENGLGHLAAGGSVGTVAVVGVATGETGGVGLTVGDGTLGEARGHVVVETTVASEQREVGQSLASLEQGHVLILILEVVSTTAVVQRQFGTSVGTATGVIEVLGLVATGLDAGVVDHARQVGQQPGTVRTDGVVQEMTTLLDDLGRDVARFAVQVFTVTHFLGVVLETIFTVTLCDSSGVILHEESPVGIARDVVTLTHGVHSDFLSIAGM